MGTCQWKLKHMTMQYMDSQQMCMPYLYFFMTEKPHGTWFKKKSAVRVWGFYGSATALPSCQPLALWAKACKGTTEWADSSLEAWQQLSGSNPRQTLTALLLLPSSSLYYFVSWAGEIWQIFLSTAAATYFSRFICNHRLSPSAFSKVFSLASLCEKRPDKHRWKSSIRFCPFSLRGSWVWVQKKRVGELSSKMGLLSFLAAMR